MSRVLFPQEARFLTDWNGQSIFKHALDKLQPGCIVRCVIGNESQKSLSWEAVYFEIIKIKDGTFWGKTLNTYRLDDYIGLPIFIKLLVISTTLNRQTKSSLRQDSLPANTFSLIYFFHREFLLPLRQLNQNRRFTFSSNYI